MEKEPASISSSEHAACIQGFGVQDFRVTNLNFNAITLEPAGSSTSKHAACARTRRRHAPSSCRQCGAWECGVWSVGGWGGVWGVGLPKSVAEGVASDSRREAWFAASGWGGGPAPTGLGRLRMPHTLSGSHDS